jgi:superfamily I DNA and/or RNA helicase
MTFSTVLVDEAAQCMESATLPALVHGCERIILIGDQNQLPPVVSCPTALEHGLGVSLFARLAAGGMQPCLLDEQYRMHPKIADFSSSRFYGGRIRSRVAPEDRPLPLGFNWPNKKVPVVFMDVSPEDTYKSEDVGNGGEGEVMAGGISFRKMLESPFQSLMAELEGSDADGGSGY